MKWWLGSTDTGFLLTNGRGIDLLIFRDEEALWTALIDPDTEEATVMVQAATC